MKPNFALTLSFEGIGLLHRAFPGWNMVGEVSLQSDDLASALSTLLDKAQRLDASGVTTKLVLPNDQIRYLQIDADGLGPDEIASAVAHALDGATPYALQDLVYDWSISAGQVYIAAVAAETLREAEAFTTDHGFNPLCFVAVPDGSGFIGEPWFGPTDLSKTLVPEGKVVARDTAAIRVIGNARIPSESTPEPQPIPSAALADTPLSMLEPEPESSETQETAADEAEMFEEELATGDISASESEKETEDAADEEEPSVAAAVSEEVPDATPTEEIVTFSSIRAVRDDTPSSAPKLAGASRDIELHDEGAAPEDEPEDDHEPLIPTVLDASVPTDDTPDPTPQEIELPQSTAEQIGASLSPNPEDRLAPFDSVAPSQPDHSPQTDQTDGSFTTSRDALIARAAERFAAKPMQKVAVPEARDETQRMTIFGAREPAEVGGKPRYLGVVLTAVLLVFLVGVAAWASLFLDERVSGLFGSGAEEPVLASVPDTETVAEDLADEEPEYTIDTEEFGTTVAALPDVTADVDDPAQDAQPEARPAQLNQDEARARYAVTGVWQRAPDAPVAPESIALEDFYLTSIDPKVTEQDAIALPDSAGLLGDLRPRDQLDPPAAGTAFALDERGFVRATPNGALSPNGVRIFAGQPRLVPGDRPAPPARLITEGEDVVPLDPAIARLAAIRPQTRPENLAEQNERGTIGLGGRTRSELAVLRPRLRPQSAQELALQAAAASTAGSLVNPDAASVEAAVAAAVQAPDPFVGATAQAVAASLKPRTRPGNFAQIVRRSQQETQPVQTAVVVPSNQRLTPSAPTTTTVARAATEQNVLKLRRVNLIGVYGAPSNRRALVRLPNGRYKKVQIGDRLDGGKVAAIGDSEIRYIKGGRSLILQMPQG